MQIIVRRRSATRVHLVLRGQLDGAVTDAFADELDRLLDDRVRDVEIDMHLVRFIGSSALGALLRANRRARERGGELVLVRPSAAVREPLAILGLEPLLRVSADTGSTPLGRAPVS